MSASDTLRRDVAQLTSLAFRDLASLWRQVPDAATARAALNDVLPALVDTYGASSAALAAEWYDNLRLKAGAGGSFTAIPADITDSGASALVGWATSKASDMSTLQTLVAGGLQRRIVNFSRLTVMESSVADPGARGWQRVGDGNSCEFCSMLLGRGAVYTEATADFPAHDHCTCGAEPEFA